MEIENPKMSKIQMLRLILMALRYPKITLKMIRSNKNSIKKFINESEEMKSPIIPDESPGNPMREGMIYLMFSSNEKETPINMVYRIFWVEAPIMRVTQIDTFLLSEDPKIENRQFDKFFDKKNVFRKYMKGKFYQEVIEKDTLSLLMEGKWEDGYELNFKDYRANISGKLKYSPIKNGILCYFQNKPSVAPSVYQQFYDIFGLNIEGEITVENKNYKITKGRGIIEHSKGIFSTGDIHTYTWMDLQCDEGSIHIFDLILNVDNEIIPASQGASTLNGEWKHYLTKDINLKQIKTIKVENWEYDLPIEWEFSNSSLNLHIISVVHKHWITVLPNIRHYVMNHILKFDGVYNGKNINGKGTVEYFIVKKIT